MAVAAFVLRFVFPRVDPGRHRSIIRWWSGKLLAILDIRVRLDGAVPFASGSPAMIAANHVSWLDIFVVSSVEPTRFIAKSEIRDWPVAGFVAERAGTLFIRRDRRRDTARINEEVHDALGEGDCVGLFPEGTTTEGDRLLRFHSSLFEPAVANGAMVYPAALRYEHADGPACRAVAYVGEISFMQSMGLVMRQRGVVARIAFAQPVSAAGLTRREVARLTESRVAGLLGVAAPHTAPGTPAGPPAASR